MKKTATIAAITVAVALAAAMAAAVAFGGPKTPAPMASIADPFKAVDFSTLPKPLHYRGADGSRLAYRHYAPNVVSDKGSVVLVHGSAGSSASMHPLARAFAAAGYDTYAIDVRGHGDSGPHGRIGYVGQLESDLQSFAQSVLLPQPATLAGFSAGGGFVLRFAGGPAQTLFHDYLLLAPLLGPDAPNYKPQGGGWVEVGVPRLVALGLLNHFGVDQFNGLTVTRFAVRDQGQPQAELTPEYGYALAANFGPQRDFGANIRAVGEPCAIVAGSDDEIFDSSKLEPIVRALGRDWPVTLVGGLGHIPLTLDPRGHAAAIAAVEAMRRGGAK